jgi:hypothetical protein
MVLQWLRQLVDAQVLDQQCPAWLLRPGRTECGELWPVVQEIYTHLTGLKLPEIMSLKENRRIDVLLAYPDGTHQFFEIDEKQHFNPCRAITLEHYPNDVPLGFAKDTWKTRAFNTRPRSGGWARPCPPLFPEPGGRHQQRAFRDMLADLLPPRYGFRPTIRVSDRDVSEWQRWPQPLQSVSQALIDRGLPAEYVVLDAK